MRKEGSGIRDQGSGKAKPWLALAAVAVVIAIGVFAFWKGETVSRPLQQKGKSTSRIAEAVPSKGSSVQPERSGQKNVSSLSEEDEKDVVRQKDKSIPIDAPVGGDESGKTVADTLAAEGGSPDALDEDWRKAVLASAREHVLMHTALSDRDRQVYRAYAMEGEDIAEVAKKFGLSRNSVSQIKTRIEKRIIAAGREMIAKEGL